MTSLMEVGVCCMRAKPRPWSLEASVTRVEGKSGLKGEMISGEESKDFALRKAFSCSSVHLKALLGRSSGRSLVMMWVRSGMKDPSWLARPRKDRSEDTLLGAGNSTIALCRLGSVEIPESETMCPAKWMDVPRMNLVMLIVM